ncbi:MAG: hypothetical protein WC529_05710 [Candidatus Margulisiibacteriota bacterium]
MGGGIGAMSWLILLLSVVWAFGFAYIIWVLAAKENGGMKTAGQVMAVLIALLTIVLLIYGGTWGSKARNRMMRGGMMMEGRRGGQMEMPCMKSDMSDKQKMDCMMKKMGKGRK